jgi:KUP system potassium uptake protein
MNFGKASRRRRRGVTHHADGHAPESDLKLAIGALGVVFGDIGTSPLYAIKECFDPVHGLAPSPENAYGILSLVFWSLTFVVTIKYLIFVMRADNKGEGGIMALLALVIPKLRDSNKFFQSTFLILAGLFGAALLYGDGIITPAISVLSAVEGLRIATPAFQPYIVPITVGILIGIFWVQKRGTQKLGALFGPATLVWFLTIAACGAPWIVRHPEILMSLSPVHALLFFTRNGWLGFFVLSAVVLCITGAEALYADMGHFGRRPIRMGWYSIVFPCLMINYLGQGAAILEKGQSAIENPFYSLVQGAWLYPLVVIATVATVIASQALISGAYSLTQQAVQLGYLPRVTIVHTSRTAHGQIFVPRVNAMLMVSCVALVLLFQESTRLAAAYGIAVTGTMTITTLLFYAVTRHIWGWSVGLALPLTVFLLGVDLAFLAANLTKVEHGGWIPLVIGLGIFSVMTTWKRGRKVLAEQMLSLAVSLEQFLERVARKQPPRVKGTAVFMTLTRDIAPSVLLQHFKHNQVLHERVILLSVVTRNEPEVDTLERVRVTELSHGFIKVNGYYGYLETPDITEILALCQSCGLLVDETQLSFYLGRETFLTTGKSGMAHWRKRLFIFLSRNARSATEFFNIPPDRVIEIGTQIQI